MSGQSNHQNTNGSDTRDIALSGEPTVAMQPLGKRVASFPFQRRLDFRVGKEGKPLLKDLREGSRNTAAWVQTRGIQVPQPCASCASGHGPFSSCVVFRTADGHRFCEGSCANCYFGHKAVRCSFRVSSPDLPRASLLEQFQSARPTPEPQIQRELQSTLKARPAPGEVSQANKKRRTDSSISTPDVPSSPLFIPTDSTANNRPARINAGFVDDAGIVMEPVHCGPRGSTQSQTAASRTRTPSVPPAKTTSTLSRRSGHATPFVDEDEGSLSLSEAFNALTTPEPSRPQANSTNQTNGSMPPSTETIEPSQRRLTQVQSNEEQTECPIDPPLGTFLHSQPSQPRPGTNGTNMTNGTSVPISESTAVQNPRHPTSSKGNKNVIPCPLTPTMYNDTSLLRLAVQDLSKFLHVAEKRLKELEESSAKADVDVWGIAIAELDK